MTYFFEIETDQNTSDLLFERLKMVFANADAVSDEITRERYDRVIAGKAPLVGVEGFGDDTWDGFNPLATTVKNFERERVNMPRPLSKIAP